MKAVFILGSPRKNGNTARISGEITRGLQEQGVTVKVFTLSDLSIKYCMGDKACNETGVCIHNDDAYEIVRAMYESQLVIVASPSYWGDVTAQMKTFIDRTTPFSNTNPARKLCSSGAKGIAVAIRAGNSKKENNDIIHTIEHFLGHHDIPLISSFTVEGLDTPEDLTNRPEVLQDAHRFGKSIVV